MLHETDVIAAKCIHLGIMAQVFYFKLKTTKAITMEVSVISFGTNPHIVDKLRTDQLRNCD